MKFLFSFCVLFIILGGCAFSDQKIDCSEICPCPLNNHQTEVLNFNIENCPENLTMSLFTAINDLRQKNGLSPLKVTSKLNQYSQVWANYLAHRNLSYQEPYNIHGSNLIYSYRTFSNNILDVKEVLDFWINTHKDLSVSRSEFENNLEALFDVKSEFIGFGCSSSKVDPSRIVGSNERATQHFLVVNIEINSNKPITICNSVSTSKSQIPAVSGGSTAFRDGRSSSENDLNSISNLSSVRLVTLNNNASTNSPVKPIIIHSTSPVPNKQSTINIPTSLNTNSKHYIDLITTTPGITTTIKQPSIHVSASTISEAKSQLAQDPISEPNFLINPSSSVKPSIIHPPSFVSNSKSIFNFPISTQSRPVAYQNTKPRTTTTLRQPLFPVSSTAKSEPTLISAPKSTPDSAPEPTPESTTQNNSKLSYENYNPNEFSKN